MASATASCAMKRDLCWPDRICGGWENAATAGMNSASRFCWRPVFPGSLWRGMFARFGKARGSAVGEGSIAVQFAHQYLAGF